MPRMITYKYQKEKYFSLSRAMACFSEGKLQYVSIQNNAFFERNHKIDQSEVIQHRMRFKTSCDSNLCYQRQEQLLYRKTFSVFTKRDYVFGY